MQSLSIFFKDTNSNIPSYTTNLQISGINRVGQEVIIHTFDSNAHSGWNKVTFSGLYSQIQVNGTGCDLITEIKIEGDVLINTTDTSVSCSVNINQVAAGTGMRRSLIALTQTITYDSAVTKVITSISPSVGSAAGGDTITI